VKFQNPQHIPIFIPSISEATTNIDEVPASTDNDPIPKKVENPTKKIWEAHDQRDPIEQKRDMVYLRAWLKSLGPYEMDCLVELTRKDSPEEAAALDAYFDAKEKTKDGEIYRLGMLEEDD
jgi:hypothetical protein